MSVVLHQYEERRDPQSGMDCYVIELKDFLPIPKLDLSQVISDADSEIRLEIDKLKKMPFPVYYPFVKKGKVRPTIEPAERYVSLATRTIVQIILEGLGGKWREWGIDPEFHERGEDDDIKKILENSSNKSDGTPTEVNHLIDARRGQGKFRADLDEIWGKKCGVLGLTTRDLLMASHIKPWSASSD
jgi:hypothetical protein